MVFLGRSIALLFFDRARSISDGGEQGGKYQLFNVNSPGRRREESLQGNELISKSRAYSIFFSALVNGGTLNSIF